MVHFAVCQSAHTQDAPVLPENVGHTSLTPATIAQIEKGKTTRDEVINLYGSPNIITQNSDGREVWHYSRMSYERRSESDSSGAGLVPSLVISSKQSKAFATGGSKSIDLAIIFDKEGRVESYKSVTSQF